MKGERAGWEHLNAFTHTALVTTGWEPITQCEITRKRQQWYGDWLLPVLREKLTCFRHQKLEHYPSPPEDDRPGKREQALGQLPLVCVGGISSGQSQHILLKVFVS